MNTDNSSPNLCCMNFCIIAKWCCVCSSWPVFCVSCSVVFVSFSVACVSCSLVFSYPISFSPKLSTCFCKSSTFFSLELPTWIKSLKCLRFPKAKVGQTPKPKPRTRPECSLPNTFPIASSVYALIFDETPTVAVRSMSSDKLSEIFSY